MSRFPFIFLFLFLFLALPSFLPRLVLSRDGWDKSALTHTQKGKTVLLANVIPLERLEALAEYKMFVCVPSWRRRWWWCAVDNVLLFRLHIHLFHHLFIFIIIFLLLLFLCSSWLTIVNLSFLSVSVFIPFSSIVITFIQFSLLSSISFSSFFFFRSSHFWSSLYFLSFITVLHFLYVKQLFPFVRTRWPSRRGQNTPGHSQRRQKSHDPLRISRCGVAGAAGRGKRKRKGRWWGWIGCKVVMVGEGGERWEGKGEERESEG